MSFDLDSYLLRVGLHGRPTTPDGLKKLQAAQIASIPFENVLPFLGQAPDLDEKKLWQKPIVEQKGGYCFELNALPSALPSCHRQKPSIDPFGRRYHL